MEPFPQLFTPALAKAEYKRRKAARREAYFREHQDAIIRYRQERVQRWIAKHPTESVGDAE